MPYNSNERLEQAAREALVADDLSAKMKQWRKPEPPLNGHGRPKNQVFRLVLLISLLAGGLYYFWPAKQASKTPIQVLQPQNSPEAPQQNASDNAPVETPPIAQKPIQTPDRYLALAQSNYQAPDFASEIRGENKPETHLLNIARSAILEKRYQDALNAMEKVPSAYKTDVTYLRAHAFFGLKQYDKSALLFAQLSSSVRYGDAAQWFEVLALLPNYDQTKPVLRRKLKLISDDENHTFYNEANALGLKL